MYLFCFVFLKNRLKIKKHFYPQKTSLFADFCLVFFFFFPFIFSFKKLLFFYDLFPHLFFTKSCLSSRLFHFFFQKIVVFCCVFLHNLPPPPQLRPFSQFSSKNVVFGEFAFYLKEKIHEARMEIKIDRFRGVFSSC